MVLQNKKHLTNIVDVNIVGVSIILQGLDIDI